MAELAGKTILLVDDDPEVRQAIELALEPLGSTVLVADNGNTAVELADENILMPNFGHAFRFLSIIAA